MNAFRLQLQIAPLTRLVKMGLFAGAFAVATPAWTQGHCQRLAAGTPADYFASQGCGLLQSVEQHHLGKGRDRLSSQHYSAAASEFRFILAQFPNHPEGLLMLAQTCERWKSPDRVVACDIDELFVRAIETNPAATGTYVVRGIYLHRAARFAEAVQSYKIAVEQKPDNANAHYNLGLSYFEMKQYVQANAHAQQAYALGVQPPGLRDRLKRAAQWNPAIAPGVADNLSK